MPKNSWTLTKSKKSEYCRVVERMRAAGADLDLAGLDLDDEWIRVTHDPLASSVCTWTGATVFAIHVRIVGIAPNTIIHGFDLSSPDWDCNAYLLDDPTVANSRLQLYRTLDKSLFHRSEVLNHRVDAEGKLRRGNVVEGLLLAQSFESVPIRYGAGRCLPLCLSIMNQFNDVQEFAFALPVERIAWAIHRRPARTGGLLELKEVTESNEQANGRSDGPSKRAGLVQ